MPRLDLSGKTFNELTYLYDVERDSCGRRYAMWRCSCGIEKRIMVYHVTIKGAVSCGHMKQQLQIALYEKTGRRATGIKRMLQIYKSGARDRGITFSLTPAEFQDLIKRDCHYCGAPPSKRVLRGKASRRALPYVCNGVDRIDSAGSYLITNTVPCCTRCNYAKRDLTFGAFITWIGRVASYRSKLVKQRQISLIGDVT